MKRLNMSLLAMSGIMLLSSHALANEKVVLNYSNLPLDVGKSFGKFKNIIIKALNNQELYSELFNLYKLISTNSKLKADELVLSFNQYLIDKGYSYAKVNLVKQTDNRLIIEVSSPLLKEINFNDESKSLSEVRKHALIGSTLLNKPFNVNDIKDILAKITSYSSFDDSTADLITNPDGSLSINVNVNPNRLAKYINKPYAIDLTFYNSNNPSHISDANARIKLSLLDALGYNDLFTFEVVRALKENQFFSNFAIYKGQYKFTPYITDKFSVNLSLTASLNTYIAKSVLKNLVRTAQERRYNSNVNLSLSVPVQITDYDSLRISSSYDYLGSSKLVNGIRAIVTRNSIISFGISNKHLFPNRNSITAGVRLYKGLDIHKGFNKLIRTNGGLDESYVDATVAKGSIELQTDSEIGRQSIHNVFAFGFTLANRRSNVSILKATTVASLLKTAKFNENYRLSSINGYQFTNSSIWNVNGDERVSFTWNNSFYRLYKLDFANYIGNSASLLYSELSLNLKSYNNANLSFTFGGPLYAPKGLGLSKFNTSLLLGLGI